MARKRGSRFRKVGDAQQQFESIEDIQRRNRAGKRDKKLVDAIEKSKQREQNAFKRIRKPDDVAEEFD